MGVEVKKKQASPGPPNEHWPILIRDAIFECKCGEWLNMYEVKGHQQDKHSGEEPAFLRVSLCGDNESRLECWTDWVTVCACDCGVPCYMGDD